MSENVTDSAKTYLSELGNLSKTVDRDDLPGLAKMHELFGSLANSEIAGLSADGQKVAREMVGMLEALILGEIDDANRAVQQVQEAVGNLTSAFGVAMSGSDAAQDADASVANESGAIDSDEIAQQLDKVFEETEPVAEFSNDATPLSESEFAETQSAPEETADVMATESQFAEMTEASDNAEPQEQYVSEPLIISKDEIDMVAGFVEEAGEHLDAIEAAVLEVERSPSDPEAIDSLFRPFHTIKGAAGFLNLRDIVSLTHEAETLLDQARKGSRKVTHGLIDLVFEVVDILKVQFDGIRGHLTNPTSDPIPQPPIESMIANLRDVVAGRIEPVGNEPTAGDAIKKIGENLVEQGSVPQEAVDFAVDCQSRSTKPTKVGEKLIEMGVASHKQVSQGLRPQAMGNAAQAKPSAAGGDQSVRIDTAKLDALVDMVGELVIAQTQVSASPHVASDPKLAKDVTRSTKIVRDVQDAAMAMRMIPIGPTFQKMARLVRDVARKVGKNVELTISGEDTELDKNVIQQIGDPLVHMVRNAVDHGIESAEARLAAGKTASGNVSLSAFHSGGNIVIEITDDGKGLNPEALIRKGIEKGIINEGDQLTEEQAFDLIFAPGFSTAEQVTGVSGRGVGMDVVRRNIENLKGKCEITSTAGKGSTFSIRLPLTLAIIDGMVLRVGTERFIIQTVTVENALRPTADQITSVQRKGLVLNARGRLIPLVPLGPLFDFGQEIDPCEAIVVIAQYEGGEIGIVVDELIGQQQVVIKPLGERFQKLRGISGAAILGDGKVGLILDVSGIVAAHQSMKPCSETAKSGQPVVAGSE
ncbi:MAG TPA: chemotaxis protein CheW [Phycisphaerae bacterium]|nr:chemotaxis protein CheW [Phycisphaerae bacterium]